MKLATLKDGTRDGKLVVVSRDLTQYTDASFLARTLQAALDDWRRISPHLGTIAESLENNAAARVVLRQRHLEALEYCALEDLKRFAIDLS